jgi:nanoRNase/pAp phosphatase (c-di-AMP/oligoRNAs hydrolase)
VAKHVIHSIHEKSRIAANIIQRFVDGERFLMLGHANPDEDCIAAMVAFGLIVGKFDKKATIFIGGTLHENHLYLLEICEYNGIRVTRDENDIAAAFDTIVVCDTPKPSMVAVPKMVRGLMEDSSVVKVEFDHHIASDSDYIGDPDYALVTEASSACELVGYLALKLTNRRDLLEKYEISELLSRNLVLSILTGIIGDSKMGKFLKSRREQRFYNIFVGKFNNILTAKTTNRKDSYFANKERVFAELVRLSASEEKCFSFIMKRAHTTANFGYAVLNESDSKQIFGEFNEDTIVSVARSAADALAERSSKLSLIGYTDFSREDGLVQFRIRRSTHYKDLDLRTILDTFNIKNGGGHDGAIGFRFERKDIADIATYARDLVAGIEAEIA